VVVVGRHKKGWGDPRGGGAMHGVGRPPTVEGVRLAALIHLHLVGPVPPSVHLRCDGQRSQPTEPRTLLRLPCAPVRWENGSWLWLCWHQILGRGRLLFGGTTIAVALGATCRGHDVLAISRPSAAAMSIMGAWSWWLPKRYARALEQPRARQKVMWALRPLI
jgi:hypothetical protein